MTYALFFSLGGCSVLAVGEGVYSSQAVHTVLNPFALPETGFCGLPGTVSLCYSLSFHLLACVCWCDTSWAELSFCCAKGWGSEWETPCRDREALCFGHSCGSEDGRLTFCLCFHFHLLKSVYFHQFPSIYCHLFRETGELAKKTNRHGHI